jgi:hypothetical protein
MHSGFTTGELENGAELQRRPPLDQQEMQRHPNSLDRDARRLPPWPRGAVGRPAADRKER